jgi:hypothetical protein
MNAMRGGAMWPTTTAIAATAIAMAGAGVLVAHLVAQSPVPTTGRASDDRKTGLLMGTVVDFRDGQPLPGAIVSLGSDRVVTDAQGRFAFTDLPKGDYTIGASKRGFLDGAYGRQRPEGPLQVLTLAADERLGDLRVPVWKFASISGRVTDDTGAPLVDVPVDVMARVLIGGRWSLRHAGRAKTDDRGLYRVGGLAGREYVVATPPASVLPPQAADSLAYPLLYYPGVSALPQAASILLKVGESRTGLDLQRVLLPAARVAGVVTDPTGQPMSVPVVLTIRLSDAIAGGGLGTDEVMSDRAGRFAFSGVTSGSYEVTVTVTPTPAQSAKFAGRLLWAIVPLSIDAQDVGVAVPLQVGARVSGRVSFDGESGRRPPPDVLREMSAVVESADGVLIGDSPTAPLEIDASGRFTTRELLPGRYFVRITEPPPGWGLKGISVLGRDVTRVPIKIDADVSVTITMTAQPPEVSGTVRTAAGVRDAEATVLLFPQDPKSWHDFGSAPPYFRVVRASRDGGFRFGDVPPGDYCIAAVVDDPTVELLETRTLEEIARLAVRFSLGAGEKHLADLQTRSVVR